MFRKSSGLIRVRVSSNSNSAWMPKPYTLLHIFPSQTFWGSHTLKIFRCEILHTNLTFPLLLPPLYILSQYQTNIYSILRNSSVKVDIYLQVCVFFSFSFTGKQSCKFLWTVCLLVEVINPSSHHARPGFFWLLILQDSLTSSLLDQSHSPNAVYKSIRRKSTDSKMPFLFIFCSMSYSKWKTLYIKKLSD